MTITTEQLVPWQDTRVQRGFRPFELGEIARLTDREVTVLLAMATGASNAEIAAELVVAIATVKTHVASILAKLGIRDRAQAVVFAYESRLVVPR
jgi:DNA-binding NarL/FixJ family response regulator